MNEFTKIGSDISGLEQREGCDSRCAGPPKIYGGRNNVVYTSLLQASPFAQTPTA
jgi:hypothetical protein